MKLLVIIHIFYKKMWPEIKGYLDNIKGYDYDLMISQVEDDESLKQDILAYKPTATIKVFPNKGYDVYPFYAFINSTDLSGYDYVVKLHTKKNYDQGLIFNDKYVLLRSHWHELLFSFISKKSNFEKCLKLLKDEPQVGMINSCILIRTEHNHGSDAHINYCVDGAIALHKKFVPDYKHSDQVRYVCGTMFICRANLLEEIHQLQVSIDEISDPSRKHIDDFAHIFERYLGILVADKDMILADPFTSKWDRFLNRALNSCIFTFYRYRLIRKLTRFIFRCDVNEQGVREYKIFKIKIFSKQLEDRNF